MFSSDKIDVNVNLNSLRFNSISKTEAKVTISKIKMHKII